MGESECRYLKRNRKIDNCITGRILSAFTDKVMTGSKESPLPIGLQHENKFVANF